MLRRQERFQAHTVKLLLVMDENQPHIETERIYRELSDRLRQFVRSRVSSPADTDDILQNIFLHIHQNLASLRSTERLESWVFQITRNAIVNHFRRTPASETADVEIADDNFEIGNVNAEVSRCIAMLINHLPEDQKQAVSRYELEGISQAEIADRESITLSAAKSRIQRGRRKLEMMLRDCCRFQLDTRGNVLEYQQQEDACESECDCGQSCEQDRIRR
jgi:RNA polymerase sigma-70 factor, ECF subfamily